MNGSPMDKYIEPYPNDWFNSDRTRYLYDCIFPLSPLLLESKLLDKLFLAWLNHDIIHEADCDKSSELDDESLLLLWCRQQWGHRLESMYLARKNKLDLVSYRLLTVSTLTLAYELYHRLKANEETFDQLSIRYSVGKEKYNGGKFSDISLNNFPSSMQSAFTSMEAGDLHKPVRNGKNYVVLQLLKYSPASLDQQSEETLLRLQLHDWQQVMIKAVRDRLKLIE